MLREQLENDIALRDDVFVVEPPIAIELIEPDHREQAVKSGRGIGITPGGNINFITGHAVFADYLNLLNLPEAGELTVYCAAVVGAGIGFLWFNAPPAMIFMGDTGSLALGGALGAIAVATKHEIVLAIVGGLFVVEALSVIIQVLYFRRTGKRVFLMAPIHHHYEKKGWSEPQIVIRFWIIALILAMIGLATLKVR